jgi:hypothetical protein
VNTDDKAAMASLLKFANAFAYDEKVHVCLFPVASFSPVSLCVDTRASTLAAAAAAKL